MILPHLVNEETENSIINAKEMALERQPIRWDIYISHIRYYEMIIDGLAEALAISEEKQGRCQRK